MRQMSAALAMALMLVQSAALSAAGPDGAAVALAAEEDNIALIGDNLAAIVGELEGDATPGATIDKVLSSLGERLARTSCQRTKPTRTLSEWPDVTCNAPDVEALFPLYAALRRATTPTEHEWRGRMFLDAYATLLDVAPDTVIAQPREDEAADGLLRVLFPFDAWDEKLGIPRRDVHFPFVPVCNLVAASAARCSGAEQLRRQIRQAGNERDQRLFCIKEFSKRRLRQESECAEMVAPGS